VSKHPKSCIVTRLSPPTLGTKKPERRKLHSLGISDSSFEGAKTNKPAPLVNRLFSQPACFTASRTADKSISPSPSCKSFFNYFWTPYKNDPKAHQIRPVPTRVPSIHPHSNPNNARPHAEMVRALPREIRSYPLHPSSKHFLKQNDLRWNKCFRLLP
jgi:hypothetical protein